MAQMQAETCKTSTISETGEGEFVSSNDTKPDKRDWQGAPMKESNAEQGQREKDEIERDSKDEHGFSQCGFKNGTEFKPPFPAIHARRCVA